MIVSYNWLKEYVDFDLSPDDLAALLTMLGLEVEGVERVGEGLDDVVVAKVEERQQHPNADKLSLCRVNDGREILTIVCGASNFKSGDTVALARIGAVLPGDFKIKRSKIRGEESFGMLCSEKELGLAEESAGIMILPDTYVLGTPLFQAMGLKDTIFEVGLTPNRPDCLSVVGIAREIGAKLGKKIRYPEFELSEKGSLAAGSAKVVIEDSELCPRYTARLIRNCSIKPSPSWLVNRLQASGMRSINNVVDITNYVLMELGHPLHAFDFDLVAGGTIRVRRATEGEIFTTLDSQERTLVASDLVICDAERPVALAGIMGGENSEIRDTTTTILLESAYFNPSAIRRTSKRLGLHTESSHRFERGADVEMARTALDRAASLIAELGGGEIAEGAIDVYPQYLAKRTIEFRLERSNALLGLNLSADEVLDIFQNLEFDCSVKGEGLFAVTVPTFRVDLEREIDLIEEVARVNGYEKIPTSMPRARVFSDRPPLHQRLERMVRSFLVGEGLSEVINFSFITPSEFDKIGLPSDDIRRTTVKLLNPLSDEQAVMRTTLLPGLLNTVVTNVSHRTLSPRLFELRRVYLPKEGRELPEEPLHVAGLLVGSRYPEGWNQDKSAVDFFDVKGLLESLFGLLSLPEVTYSVEGVDCFYHPGKSARIYCSNELLGSLGEIHPDVQERYGLDQPLYYFELDFEKLVHHSGEAKRVTPPPRFPDVQRDIALLIPAECPAAEIVNTVSGFRVKELENTEIFDYYTGVHVPEGKKSIAVRLTYRGSDRTLTDDEVNRIHGKVVESLTKKLDVSIR